MYEYVVLCFLVAVLRCYGWSLIAPSLSIIAPAVPFLSDMCVSPALVPQLPRAHQGTTAAY